jgi:hypothetical protein
MLKGDISGAIIAISVPMVVATTTVNGTKQASRHRHIKKADYIADNPITK